MTDMVIAAAVCTSATASLIMNGGSIVGCQVANGGAPEGGGVYLSASNAAFTMNDGAHIIGCW